MHKLGIDVETQHKANLIRRLKALKTTQQVEDGGMYWEDRNYSQVHITTTWTEDELEDWLYKTKGIEYVGTWMIARTGPMDQFVVWNLYEVKYICLRNEDSRFVEKLKRIP